MTRHRLLNRIQAVETKLAPKPMDDFHVHFIGCTEQHKHPELYEIESTDTHLPDYPGGPTFYFHSYKRKDTTSNHDQTNDAGPY